jgi:predicted  nucleic acid-binding Zn-ribbon protein
LYTNFIAGSADAYKEGVRNYRKQIQKDIEETANAIQKLQTKMESEMLIADAGKDTNHDHAGILKQIEELNDDLQDLEDLKAKTFDPDFQPTGEPTKTKN